MCVFWSGHQARGRPAAGRSTCLPHTPSLWKTIQRLARRHGWALLFVSMTQLSRMSSSIVRMLLLWSPAGTPDFGPPLTHWFPVFYLNFLRETRLISTPQCLLPNLHLILHPRTASTGLDLMCPVGSYGYSHSHDVSGYTDVHFRS